MEGNSQKVRHRHGDKTRTKLCTDTNTEKQGDRHMGTKKQT